MPMAKRRAKPKPAWPPARVFVVLVEKVDNIRYVATAEQKRSNARFYAEQCETGKRTVREYRLVPKRKPAKRLKPTKKPEPFLPRGVIISAESLERFAEHAKKAGKKAKPRNRKKAGKRG